MKSVNNAKGKNTKNQKLAATKTTVGKRIKKRPLTKTELIAAIWNGVNLPNKLTILRILLVPIFLLLISYRGIPHGIIWALVIFLVAASTDFLDGYIARSRNMVTPLGQFLDPIADKLLVTAALVAFVGHNWIAAWPVAVILIRDLIVGAVRLVAVQSDENVVIPARTSGKVKTVITMITITTLIFLWTLGFYGFISFEGTLEVPIVGGHVPVRGAGVLLIPMGNVLMYICAALTVFSGAQYVWDARYILKEELIDKENRKDEDIQEEEEEVKPKTKKKVKKEVKEEVKDESKEEVKDESKEEVKDEVK
jgi:CDP-diacylglycerol--glycerol-3-phosphate 3-phosphatidyltransferase